MALSTLGGGECAFSDTCSEGNSCSVMRQGVREQDPHMAFSDMIKEEDLMDTVWGYLGIIPRYLHLILLEG